MGFKLKFPKSEKQNPEVVAKNFCSEIRKKIFWLKCQTYRRENIQQARIQMVSFCGKYCRNLESGSCSRLVQRADCISKRVLKIVNLDLEDWNNHRRGQQFRRLDESLADFEDEWCRSQ